MDPDPMQFVEEDGEKKDTETVVEAKKSSAHLNSVVAISVALPVGYEYVIGFAD